MRPGISGTDATSRWACFGLWGPRARDVLAPLTPDPLDFGYMTMRELAVGDVPCARSARDLHRASWAGSSTARPSSGPGCGGALWEAGEQHGLRGRRLPRDRHAAPGEGLPRMGGRHHARRGRPTRRAWASASKDDNRAFSSDATRSCRPRCRGQSRSALPRGSTTRCSVALGNEPVARGTARSSGACTTGGYGYTCGAARSPTPTCRRAHDVGYGRSRSTSSGSGSAGGVRGS